MKIFYRKGNLWGRDGYYLSTEYIDERFYFGTLAEIKKMFGRRASAYEWIKL